MMEKRFYSIILMVLLNIQLAHAAPKNILEITPDDSSGRLDTPATVLACCGGSGNGVYCTEQTDIHPFVFSVGSSSVRCPNAGVQIKPDLNFTKCIVRGNFCNFPAGPGIAPRQLGIYRSQIVQVTIDGVKENLEYGRQFEATGWYPNPAGEPSAWGFDGMGTYNFNRPNSYVEGSAVLADPIEACSEITNADAIAGNIALIRRGSCQFGTKILNAEHAGAIAVIVMNSVSNETPFTNLTMLAGDDGLSTTLPAAIIHKEDSDVVEGAINSGQQVSFIMGNVQ